MDPIRARRVSVMNDDDEFDYRHDREPAERLIEGIGGIIITLGVIGMAVYFGVLA